MFVLKIRVTVVLVVAKIILPIVEASDSVLLLFMELCGEKGIDDGLTLL